MQFGYRSNMTNLQKSALNIMIPNDISRHAFMGIHFTTDQTQLQMLLAGKYVSLR
jgi:hypothetical protein